MSVNRGGNNPQAANKMTYTTEVSQSEQFTAGENGSIVGFVCMPPLTPQQIGFEVPKGQTAVLVSVVYSNVKLVDETSGASIAFPGTFEYLNPDYAP